MAGTTSPLSPWLQAQLQPWTQTLRRTPCEPVADWACEQVTRLVVASVDRRGAAAEAALRFDRAALAVLRLVVACTRAAGGSHAVLAEAAAFLELHAQGLLRMLHNAGSGIHRCCCNLAGTCTLWWACESRRQQKPCTGLGTALLGLPAAQAAQGCLAHHGPAVMLHVGTLNAPSIFGAQGGS